MTQTTSGASAAKARANWVLDLGAANPRALTLVGGKAANLGELIRAGLPVPPGFCITTEAYGQVAASASIDFDAVDAAGARDALLASKTPPDIAASIIDAYNRLERTGGRSLVRNRGRFAVCQLCGPAGYVP